MNKTDVYYIGYFKDHAVRYKASSGGIGTALIKYLLGMPQYGTAVNFKYDKNTLSYIPHFIYSFDQYDICGSIYHDINIFKYIKEHIDEIKDGLIVSAPPCQVDAIREYLSSKLIKYFIISFSCSGQNTIEATYMLFKILSLDKRKIEKYQYRGNGWPSGIQILMNNGSKIFKENYTKPWSEIVDSGLFKPKRCFYCTKDSSYTADINLADPWLKDYLTKDNIGNTLFRCNTELSKDIILEMSQTGEIIIAESSLEVFKQAQRPNFEKHERIVKQKKFIKLFMYLYDSKIYRRFMTINYITLKINNKIINIIKQIYATR